MKDLRTLAQQQKLHIQENPPGQGGLIVSGLKSGVNQVVQMVNTAVPLRRELRVKEEDNLYLSVAWCILVPNESWVRLPKADNYKLERGNTANGIVDAKGTKWNVNLEKTEARSQTSDQVAKLKRLENLPDFTFPLYWDSMDPGENLKEVLLDPQSEEYRTVLKPFRKTVKRTVLKIVRVQNIHLRRAYEAKNKHISDKNKLDGGAGEKLLYHGTSQDSLDSIKTGGFNRSFSGKNATAYGQGTYFAVDASYSANSTYSRPTADGSKSIFVARVLTGVFTQGRSDMKMPPPRSSDQPHNRYDSLVDRVDNPSMFVVFHDDQAYPDYLITFS
uniref:Poly [ADP-ribose] polymerase n=2 Tax=Oryzias melastigma TaxID=30732 RepID=A0A3B3CC42_ORYME